MIILIRKATTKIMSIGMGQVMMRAILSINRKKKKSKRRKRKKRKRKSPKRVNDGKIS
jgi:hypothetical protein